ncbi:MAG TPA: sigma-70 family RNA polymerase sigma factor [bacterium]|nr:sigma-70 family RNA polymerase sigma factor [bacterium]
MSDSQELTEVRQTLERALRTRDDRDLGQTLFGQLHRLAASRMAALPPGNTLQPTALVNEVWLRLRDDADDLRRKRLYFAAAARAMRDILVEQVRAKRRLKRGGGTPVAGDSILDLTPDTDGLPPVDLLALREALERLEQRDPRKAEVVLLRFFGGLQHSEIAAMLDITERTVERDWRFAKAWLRAAIEDGDDG